MLVYRNGSMRHRNFNELPDLLPPGSFLVFNNTRVIPARLLFHRKTGARIELFILNQYVLEKRELLHNQSVWTCMVGNKKKWKEGEKIELKTFENGIDYQLVASWFDKEKDLVLFTWTPSGKMFLEVISLIGLMPIPPYLNREAEQSDNENYQTVYAKINGAVAAPTAGLHFTQAVFEGLTKAGIGSTELTLHVGLGTFKPMKSGSLTEHEMHGEKVVISLEILHNIRLNINNLIAVGTTSLRALESLFWVGFSLLETCILPVCLEQFEPYKEHKSSFSPEEVLENLELYMAQNGLGKIEFETRIFIMPGYQFKMIKGLITNFHQPKSTLLVLVSALVGEDWKRIYAEALENDYRFLSYGDSSLLMPGDF